VLTNKEEEGDNLEYFLTNFLDNFQVLFWFIFVRCIEQGLNYQRQMLLFQVSNIVMCFVNSHLKPQFFRCHNELGIDQVQHPGADHMDFKLEDNGAATNFQMYTLVYAPGTKPKIYNYGYCKQQIFSFVSFNICSFKCI
jgi:hypothetical protein